MVEDQLIQQGDRLALAAQIQPERIEREVGEIEPCQAIQLKPEQRRLRPGAGFKPAGKRRPVNFAPETWTGQRVTG